VLKALWVAPIVMILIGVMLLLYNYFVIYIPREVAAHKLDAVSHCPPTLLYCPPPHSPNYWTWYAIAGWAMISIGLVVGVSYYYVRAIYPRQNTQKVLKEKWKVS
jgi:hypothetical protein